MASLQRIDTDALKQDRPIADVVARYGIDLRRSGRGLVGRCPFHTDNGRPNLYVYPATDSFYCFRCGVGGDAITFVERIESVGFREAVTRLLGGASSAPVRRPAALWPTRHRNFPTPWGADEWACLEAAVELYHNRLLTESRALYYIARRGLVRETLENCHVGYAAGDELATYLRWRGVPIRSALRTGLIRRGGDEAMAGRIVIPEIRRHRTIWLVGRTIDDDHAPRYLGLPGSRRILGWDRACLERTVCLVEGAFDWLTLQQWGVPSLALLGTHVRPATVEALRRFDRVYLTLDSDAAGREATDRIARALGPAALPVLLTGVKDVAELATRPDGAAHFRETIDASDRALAA
jgi:DNA primase